MKDELAVCHRYECLRVPARAAPQLGLPLPARPPPDQRLRRLPTRTELLALGPRYLQQDSRGGGGGSSGGPELLFPQLQLSQQLLSAPEERGERRRARAAHTVSAPSHVRTLKTQRLPAGRKVREHSGLDDTQPRSLFIKPSVQQMSARHAPLAGYGEPPLYFMFITERSHNKNDA